MKKVLFDNGVMWPIVILWFIGKELSFLFWVLLAALIKKIAPNNILLLWSEQIGMKILKKCTKE
jgi:hypothetical protein